MPIFRQIETYPVQAISPSPPWNDFGGGHKSERNIRLYKKQGYQVFKHQRISDNLEPDLCGEIEIGDLANCGEVQITRRSTRWQFHSIHCLW
jgi:hypothetical protein